MPSGSQFAAPFWLLVLCLIYISQMYFYGGRWPDGSRYDFPGLLYVPAAVLIVFMMAIELIPEREQLTGLHAARTALTFSLAVMCLGKGYGHIVERLESNVADTQSFVSSLARVTSALRASGDYALTVETESVLDYEKVFSIVRFLRAYGVENTIFLTVSDEIHNTAAGYRDPDIVRDLLEVSATGNAGPTSMNNTRQLASNPFAGYSPLSELAAFGSKCYALILSGPGISECLSLR